MAAAAIASVKTGSRQRLMWHRNMSQHSSQAVASDCCAQHSYDNTLGQVLKITFYGQSALTPESFHARSTHSLKARCSWIRTPWSYPGTPPSAHSTTPGPINTSRSPVTDGCRGQQGLAGGRKGGWLRLGRGVGAFGIVVTWPVCLSVCRWMRSMWPTTPPPFSPPSTLRSQGFDCRSRSLDGGIQGSSRTNP